LASAVASTAALSLVAASGFSAAFSAGFSTGAAANFGANGFSSCPGMRISMLLFLVGKPKDFTIPLVLGL
jgi:hypothetical protein